MNATNSAPQKSEGWLRKSMGWLMQEWVFQLVLCLAVVSAVVDGVLSLGGGSLTS